MHTSRTTRDRLTQTQSLSGDNLMACWFLPFPLERGTPCIPLCFSPSYSPAMLAEPNPTCPCFPEYPGVSCAQLLFKCRSKYLTQPGLGTERELKSAKNSHGLEYASQELRGQPRSCLMSSIPASPASPEANLCYYRQESGMISRV